MLKEIWHIRNSQYVISCIEMLKTLTSKKKMTEFQGNSNFQSYLKILWLRRRLKTTGE